MMHERLSVYVGRVDPFLIASRVAPNTINENDKSFDDPLVKPFP